MSFFFIILGLGLAIVGLGHVIKAYNELHRYHEQVKKSRSDTKIAIDRRAAAVNDLAQVAQSFGQIEQLVTLQASRDNSAKGMSAAYQMAGSVLQHVQYAAQIYPNLKSNEHYLSITRSIEQLEYEIQWYRNRSNDLVAHFNTNRQSFPVVIFANAMGLQRESYVELDTDRARPVAAPLNTSADEARRLDRALDHAHGAYAIEASPEKAVLLPGTPIRSSPPTIREAAALPSPTVIATPIADARDGHTAYAPPLPSTTLRFTQGPLSGQSISIGPSTLIGREPSVAKLIVPHPQVSSAHAWIGWNGASLVFVDRGSTNGSTINGAPVRPGDEIPIGASDVVTLGQDDAVSFIVEQITA